MTNRRFIALAVLLLALFIFARMGRSFPLSVILLIFYGEVLYELHEGVVRGKFWRIRRVDDPVKYWVVMALQLLLALVGTRLCLSPSR
jgi:hypothetical protein